MKEDCVQVLEAAYDRRRPGGGGEEVAMGWRTGDGQAARRIADLHGQLSGRRQHKHGGPRFGLESLKLKHFLRFGGQSIRAFTVDNSDRVSSNPSQKAA